MEIYFCAKCGKIEPVFMLTWSDEHGYLCQECYDELYNG